MLEKIMSVLENLDLEDLKKLRDHLNDRIRSRLENDSDRRQHQRVPVKISSTLEIEREQEFFYQTHKATIKDMSIEGVGFTTQASLIKGDILSITFRLPSTGEQKMVDCKVVRVRDFHKGSQTLLEVGVVAVEKKEVMSYRDMLKRRGR